MSLPPLEDLDELDHDAERRRIMDRPRLPDKAYIGIAIAIPLALAVWVLLVWAIFG